MILARGFQKDDIDMLWWLREWLEKNPDNAAIRIQLVGNSSPMSYLLKAVDDIGIIVKRDQDNSRDLAYPWQQIRVIEPVPTLQSNES